MKQPTFIQRKNGHILWSRGDYCYEITEGQQPYKIIRTLVNIDSDAALEVFQDMVSKNPRGIERFYA